MRVNGIDLRDRCAIVTGAARGLGRASAERLLASGARVVAWDANGALLEETVARLDRDGALRGVAVDISDPASVERAVAAATEFSGTPAILVNSAGIGGSKQPSWTYPIDEWKRIIDVNLTGTWLCCRAVVPLMVDAGYGRVVNIASMSGKDGNPNTSPYAASKGGLIALTKSMGKELARSGVLVNCIAPALIDTELVQATDEAYIAFLKEKIPMGRLGRAEEVAAMTAWLCSDECSFNAGAVFDLSGGRATY